MSELDIARGKIFLKRGRTKAVAMHHPWVFEEAIDRIEGNPNGGDLVEVFDPVGRFIGRGYLSPKSKLRTKLFSWVQGEKIDAEFWRGRFSSAVKLRTEFLGLGGPGAAMRLVNAEGDGIPGMMVDRYADYLTVEFLTLGMATRSAMFVDILRDLTGVKGILERPEADVAKFEGLTRTEGVLWGEMPPDLVEITEGPAKFLVDLRRGQKTGFYLDQRENRLRVGALAKGRKVLDAFCYTGAFAIHAALGGASSVTGIDSSGPSLELGVKNEDLNGVTIQFERGNAFERLRMLNMEERTFDMVILDPPKLARGRTGLPKALAAYKDADLSALKLLEPGGILVTCSCSGLVTETDFVRALNDAAVDVGRRLRVVEKRGCSSDHPFDPACPETDYLQCLIARVSD
jgi:23S rRNA (cytosine1962-C5)-methyltransferase